MTPTESRSWGDGHRFRPAADVLGDLRKPLWEIVRAARGEALLLFGSWDRGQTWPESDVDLFLLTARAQKHTAFFTRHEGVALHVNVAAPSVFQEYLANPRSRTIHALAVTGTVLLDETDWLEGERKRLSGYPARNKRHQIAERLESALHALYAVRKQEHLRPGDRCFAERHRGLETVLEMQAIERGVYYGSSVLAALEGADRALYESVSALPNDRLATLLDERIAPLCARWIPPLIEELRALGPEHTCTGVSQDLGLDLLRVFDRAEAMGLLRRDRRETTIHGFPVTEEVLVVGSSE